MPRSARHTPGGFVYHALNRATARLKLFRKAADYEAFLRVFDEALDRHPIRVLAYCLMPTHWHVVLWPADDGQVSAFLRWLTLTHSVRWHKHYQSTGSGHVYQNRFKAFAVAEDAHLLTVVRYVERNALRAGLVPRAEDWRWSSLACRLAGGAPAQRRLHAWPIPRPPDWLPHVAEPQTEGELTALRQSLARGRPYGSAAWVDTVVQQLGLQSTMRSRGRPRKHGTDLPEK
jgi:putative transposase